jgi:hypothetical protein
MCQYLRFWITAAAPALVACLTALHMGAAQAVLVTFDDLTLSPDPDFDSTPVTDQYQHLGLMVDEGYLRGPDVDNPTQSLLGGPYFRLHFTGPLPTYVSMFVSSPHQDQVRVSAWGPSGFIDDVYTDGWAGPDNETPYRPNQYVSFHGASGISQVNLDAFYFLRTGAAIDNLYFGNVPAVPEPASLASLAAGLLVLSAGWRVTRRRRDSSPGRAAAPRSR